jgi:hypothetical protein
MSFIARISHKGSVAALSFLAAGFAFHTLYKHNGRIAAHSEAIEGLKKEDTISLDFALLLGGIKVTSEAHTESLARLEVTSEAHTEQLAGLEASSKIHVTGASPRSQLVVQ